MIRSSVVLPQPDGPSSEKNSPCRISSVVAASAVIDPYCLLMPAQGDGDGERHDADLYGAKSRR